MPSSAPACDTLAPMDEREVRAAVEAVHREEWGRIVAALIRTTRDFELAEEAAQDAFADALVQWPQRGLPKAPRAWLLTAARRKAIDRIRRRERFRDHEAELAALQEIDRSTHEDDDETIEDDRLRLIFTCCHPAIAPESQVALTLRTLLGLRTEEIARAFLVPVPTMAQRLVRAKSKIRDSRIPFEVPTGERLHERLDGVLATLYLAFNEGYAATDGDELVRPDLSSEAIRLARLLVALLPDRHEPRGLLALMLLTDARRAARTGPDGELVLLAEQDRSRWDRAAIDEGRALCAEALRGRPHPYAVQAAIAAVHAEAARAEDTDWPQILGLYRVLQRLAPSPVVDLNAAVARAFVDGPEAGLAELDGLHAALAQRHLFHAARADLLRRLGRRDEAVDAYRAALGCVTSTPERRFLERRLHELSGA